MFEPSISSDLIESLVARLNELDNSVAWYHAADAPEAVQPNEAIGLIQLIALLPRLLGDPSSVEIEYQITFSIYYNYTTPAIQSIRAFSWLNHKIVNLLKTGFSAVFSNGKTYNGLLRGGSVVRTRFAEPRTQDSLITSACEITIKWSQFWTVSSDYYF